MIEHSVEANISAGIYVFRFPYENLIVRVDRLVEEKKSLWAELTIQTYAPPGGYRHFYHEGLNLLAGRTRKSVANVLKSLREDVDWHQIMELICLGVIEKHREGEPAIQERDIKVTEGITWRMEPVLLEGSPTLVYGFGGTGKSYLAAIWATIIQDGNVPFHEYDCEPGKVLYLDWENSKKEYKRRMMVVREGMGLDPEGETFYRRCTQRLSSEIHEIQKIVLQETINVVVIDTAGPACGGDPESAQSSIQFFMALRSLNVTSLILAHQPKTKESRGPFGSVYWTNYPRNVYRLEASQEDGDNVVHLGLYHEKSNEGRRQKPKGMALTFSEDSVALTREEITEDSLVEHLPLHARIRNALSNGALPLDDIAEVVNMPKRSVSMYLAKHRDKFIAVDRGIWGNVTGNI